MFLIKPVCIIGFLEYRHNTKNSIKANIINPKILDYYNVKKYYKSHLDANNVDGIWNNAKNIFSLDYTHSNIENYIELEIIYGVEIDIINIMQKDTEAEHEKEIAELQIKNFAEFMYKHYNIQFDEPSETLALDISEQTYHNDSEHLFLKEYEDNCISPDDINIYEYDIKILLINGGMSNKENVISTLSKDIYRQFCCFISKAGFKLNTSSILEESDTVENCSIVFNINASENIKTWIHSMKRKIKKKFHIIKSIEYESILSIS
jgi:hypothetical protein